MPPLCARGEGEDERIAKPWELVTLADEEGELAGALHVQRYQEEESGSEEVLTGTTYGQVYTQGLARLTV